MVCKQAGCDSSAKLAIKLPPLSSLSLFPSCLQASQSGLLVRFHVRTIRSYQAQVGQGSRTAS